MQSRFINAHEGGRNKVSIVTAEEGAVCVCVWQGTGRKNHPRPLFLNPSFYCDELLISTHCWIIVPGDN